jgi:hemerythrin-like domain-containing protein
MSNRQEAGKVTRRSLLGKVGGLVAASVLLAPNTLLKEARSAQEEEQKSKEKGTIEVSPVEDLMREHGVLSRSLLIYDEIIARIAKGTKYAPEVLADTAGLIHRFIEEYHEKLEENYIFPRFEKAGKLVDLVKILLEQHRAGRRLTERITKSATSEVMENRDKKRQLGQYLRLFTRMYRPHKAREDAVLFPALHSLVSPDEYDSLGDLFEGKEQELFGKDGFKKIVEEVANLKKRLGIYELSQFTPTG